MKFENEIKMKKMSDVEKMAEVVEGVAGFVFNIDDQGNVNYAPYYYDYAVKFFIITKLIDGVSFEPEDLETNLVEIAMQDPTVEALVKIYAEDNDSLIKTYVNDIVRFRQEEYLYRNKQITDALVKAAKIEAAVNEVALDLAKKQSKIANQQIRMNEQSEEILSLMSPDEIATLNKKLANGELDVEQLANLAIEKYMATEKHDEGLRDVIKEKNDKIIELERKGQ